jgi:hypothetical protein
MAQSLNDPLLEFERSLLNILSKFGSNHTMAIATEEMNRFLMQDIREHEHMLIFLNKLSESNDHMKLVQKKEYVKIFGKAASIFEEALVPYVQRIINTLCKKAKEESAELNGPIAETFGQITFHIVLKAGNFESQFELLSIVLKSSYTLLKSANKNA